MLLSNIQWGIKYRNTNIKHIRLARGAVNEAIKGQTMDMRWFYQNQMLTLIQ